MSRRFHGQGNGLQQNAKLLLRRRKGLEKQKRPRAAVWLALLEPFSKVGALGSASGNQIPEGKACSQQNYAGSLSNRMLAQINIGHHQHCRGMVIILIIDARVN
jgi:hypothetical protein